MWAEVPGEASDQKLDYQLQEISLPSASLLFQYRCNVWSCNCHFEISRLWAPHWRGWCRRKSPSLLNCSPCLCLPHPLYVLTTKNMLLSISANICHVFSQQGIFLRSSCIRMYLWFLSIAQRIWIGNKLSRWCWQTVNFGTCLQTLGQRARSRGKEVLALPMTNHSAAQVPRKVTQAQWRRTLPWGLCAGLKMDLRGLWPGSKKADHFCPQHLRAMQILDGWGKVKAT